MRARRLIFFAAVFVFAVTLHAAGAQTSTKNITYVTDTAGAQRGDLYEPGGAGPFPAIVYVHGGSWRSGSKKSFDRFASDLAAQGYAGFSIDYDLKPHSFPLSWQEARAAIRFLRLHAREYRIDPDRIVVAGTSAGGQIAALAAIAPEGPAAPVGSAPGEEPGSVPVAAGIILNGVFDLSPQVGVINRYIGGKCAEVQQACDDASPLHHAHSSEVPLFIGHGDNDHVVNYRAALAFTGALQALNAPFTPFVAEGGPHMYWEKKQYYDANLKAVLSFLQSTMQSQSSRRR